jgi:hypothetical protein
MSKIEVIEYKELEDGSATVTLELDDEAKTMLIQEGFNSILIRHCKEVIEEGEVG